MDDRKKHWCYGTSSLMLRKTEYGHPKIQSISTSSYNEAHFKILEWRDNGLTWHFTTNSKACNLGQKRWEDILGDIAMGRYIKLRCAKTMADIYYGWQI